MNFKIHKSKSKFKPISVDKFIDMYRENNSDINTNELRKSLIDFKSLKLQGRKCDCGNSIWIVGSAILGKGCFTCITGETDKSNDYEIK